MQEKVRAQVKILDFAGLVTRPDPNDIQPGQARIQVNASCITPGELRVRPGVREVTFEDD
jgi:hypothetical protein